jgi:hypothetical protein
MSSEEPWREGRTPSPSGPGSPGLQPSVSGPTFGLGTVTAVLLIDDDDDEDDPGGGSQPQEDVCGVGHSLGSVEEGEGWVEGREAGGLSHGLGSAHMDTSVFESFHSLVSFYR